MNITINGSTIASMRAFHTLLAKELDFPAWYGGNLDALFDCLTDLHADTSVTLTHAIPWFRNFGTEAVTAVRVMRNAAAQNPNFHFYFGAESH